MKIKNNPEFLTFNDGLVTTYDTDDNDNIIPATGRAHRFGDEKIGINRYYAARQNDIELNKVIHIRRSLSVTTEGAAVIGKTRYKIEHVQQAPYTNPPSTVLSLSQRGLWEGAVEDGL